MRYFSVFLTFAVTAVMPGHLSASCYVCDELVEVDTAMAKCIVDRYDDFAVEITSNTQGRAPVNLNACSELSSDESAARGAISRLPELTGSGAVSVSKRVYLLDRNSLACLKRLVQAHEGTFDPTITFDLYEAC